MHILDQVFEVIIDNAKNNLFNLVCTAIIYIAVSEFIG